MIILGILFVVLLLFGVPVAFTVGISAASFFVTKGIPMEIVVQKMVFQDLLLRMQLWKVVF